MATSISSDGEYNEGGLVSGLFLICDIMYYSFHIQKVQHSIEHKLAGLSFQCCLSCYELIKYPLKNVPSHKGRLGEPRGDIATLVQPVSAES